LATSQLDTPVIESQSAQGSLRRWLSQWPVPVLILLIVLMMGPFLLALFISAKSRAQFDFNPWGLTFPLYFHETYPAAWRVISQSILNSLFVSTLSCIGVLFFGSLSAYVFARFDFPGKETLFVTILSLLMIPAILTLVPRFVIVHKLGLYQSLWALVLPYIVAGQVMAIFLLRTFFSSIQSEYFDAARIDGASEFRCFWSIALPLSKHILGVVAVLQVLGTWNDLFWPYLVLGSKREIFTIPVALLAFSDQLGSQIGTQMAGYIIASLPLVLLFGIASRQFVEGMTAGGLKL
jgi:ABC-type glycerol-3-phosphate transport system permease component